LQQVDALCTLAIFNRLPMESPENPKPQPRWHDEPSSLRRRIKQRAARLASALNPRERMGDFLNAFEENRGLRRKCFLLLAVVGCFVVAGFWWVPRWRENSSIAVAQQWLEAGKLDRAAEAVSEALRRAPHRVEAWQVAAEHARRAKLPQKTMNYLQQAASLKPDDPNLTLDWAAAAVAVGNFTEAHRAIAKLNPVVSASSARAERLVGEIARQRADLAEARRRFESAVRLGGPVAENEIPLGMTLLGSVVAADRRTGLALLTRWRDDSVWGVEALRPLLADALAQDERDRLSDLARALIAHPAREHSDTLNGLLALGKSDPAQFEITLREIQRAWEANPGHVAELMAWLSGTGRGAEAARWGDTLPRTMTAFPPVAVALADAMRVSKDWTALRNAVVEG
jgi:tetratricopeptide (TPR) repeat protein